MTYENDPAGNARRHEAERVARANPNSSNMWIGGAVALAVVIAVVAYAMSDGTTTTADNRPAVTETRSTTGSGTTTPPATIERSTTGSGATSPTPKVQEKPANPAAPGQTAPATPPATNR
jgi:hypothetical protein